MINSKLGPIKQKQTQGQSNIAQYKELNEDTNLQCVQTRLTRPRIFSALQQYDCISG